MRPQPRVVKREPEVKILIAGINYAPEKTGIGVYTSEMAEWFAQSGHDVDVVTGFPYYPEWKRDKSYRHVLYDFEMMNAVKVHRCYTYVPHVVSTKGRIAHEFSFTLSSFFNLLTKPNHDVIVAVLPPLGLGIAVSIVSWLFRIPLVVHVQDIQPDAAINMKMLCEGRITSLLRKIEKLIYRRARLVTTISEAMKENIQRKVEDQSKVALVPNWASVSNTSSVNECEDFGRQHNLEGKFIFLYSGNIGKKQGLETLIQASAMIESDDIAILIVGDGANAVALKQYACKCGASNIVFLPLQPKSTFSSMLKAADVCLVIQKSCVENFAYPSKMTNIMASAKPVLVTACAGTNLHDVVHNNNIGYIAEPQDAKSLYEQMMLAFNDDEIAVKSQNAYEYASDNFQKHAILSRALLSIEQIVGTCE